MAILHFLLFYISIQTVFCDWVDPHSMDTNYNYKLPKETVKSSNHYHIQKPTQETCITNLRLRRLVRLILSNSNLKSDSDYREGFLNIRLTTSEYETLINFSQNSEFEEDILNDVGAIFEKVFHKPTSEKYEELIHTMQERLFDAIFNATTGALFGAALVLLTVYRLLKADFTWLSILKYILSIAYILDFLLTYLHIIREEEIESMVKIKELGTTPPECDSKKMFWWDFFKTQIGKNPCRAYYLATYPSYSYMILPSKILIRQFKTVIIEPFGDIGEAVGNFGRRMFSALPWGLDLVMFPLMLIFSCAILMILFIFITKSHFKLNLFHLCSIEFCAPNNSSQSMQFLPFQPSKIRNDNRIKYKKNQKEVGFASNHRNLVEEVSNSNTCSSNKSNKNEIAIRKRKQVDGKKEKCHEETDNVDKDTKSNSHSQKESPEKTF